MRAKLDQVSDTYVLFGIWNYLRDETTGGLDFDLMECLIRQANDRKLWDLLETLTDHPDFLDLVDIDFSDPDSEKRRGLQEIKDSRPRVIHDDPDDEDEVL